MPTIYRFGDIVDVEYPFVDSSERKLRPAVVINVERYCKALGQVILLPITGSTWNEERLYGTIEVLDLAQAGLSKPSVVKAVLFSMTLDRVIKRRGFLDKQTRANIQKMLRQILP